MKVILIQDLKPHGKKGDLVEVSDGYAKNFAIPKKYAIEATKSAMNERDQRIAKENKRIAELKAEAQKLYDALNKSMIEVKVKCGDGKMYGSVTAGDISQNLADKGFTVDKKNIKIKEPIKALGVYNIDVWCYANLSASLKIEVVKGE